MEIRIIRYKPRRKSKALACRSNLSYALFTCWGFGFFLLYGHFMTEWPDWVVLFILFPLPVWIPIFKNLFDWMNGKDVKAIDDVIKRARARRKAQLARKKSFKKNSQPRSWRALVVVSRQLCRRIVNTPVTRHKVLVLEGQEMIGLNSMLMVDRITHSRHQGKGPQTVGTQEQHLFERITLGSWGLFEPGRCL